MSLNSIKEKIISFLLNHADPSIVLRVKNEVLGHLPANEKEDLIGKIILQKNVQSILQAQKPDGWIGNHFHGQSKKFGANMYDNMEVGLRYLAEKGFPPDSGYISKAVNSFFVKKDYDYDVYRIKKPKVPDTDYSRTAFGLYLLRSSVIIRAGHEHVLPPNNIIDLVHDINFSIKTFCNVLNYSNIDDVIDTHRKKPCFKQNTQWPCICDLRILAHSHGWRCRENKVLLASAVMRLFSFPQFGEDIYTYYRGQYISPCGAFIHRPILGCSIKDEAVGGGWFDLMEQFARCGIVRHVPALRDEYNAMLSLAEESMAINISFHKNRDAFGWEPYYGIALEQDWKTKIRKQCDILFRILLILHYTESEA